MNSYLLFLAGEFDEFLREYKKSGYDPDYFAKAKQDFFESDDYQLFTEQFQAWDSAVLNRLQNMEEHFRRSLSAKDFESMMNLIDARTKNFATAVTLNKKAAFMNQNIFEFLFDLAQLCKEDFFKIVKSEGVNPSEDIATIWSLFDVFNLFVDVTLIQKALTDPHPFVLVHCGFVHAEHAMAYFFQEYTQWTDVLNLLEEEYLNDPNHCYHEMRKFINDR
jgi:hypothetical protein